MRPFVIYIGTLCSIGTFGAPKGDFEYFQKQLDSFAQKIQNLEDENNKTTTSETSRDKAILALSNYYTGGDFPPVVINLEGKFKSGFA